MTNIPIYDSEDPERFSEGYIQNSFHTYLTSSLTHAKAERLLDADILSSAVSDLMITGPALCLYFAALRSTTLPPSVPLPRPSRKCAPMDLSSNNCPPAFIRFMNVWSRTVPEIQSLTPEYQHDLARVICNLEPMQPQNPLLDGIAADLRAVAIEISQRRSFQDRYAGDLQAALDAGEGAMRSGRRYKASFVPPPVYDPSVPRSPVSPNSWSPPTSPIYSPLWSPMTLASPPLSANWNPRPLHSPSRTLFPDECPAIEFIRETLYASLADVLEHTPSVRHLLTRDPPRAQIGAVALAIVDVAMTSVTSEGSVVGVLGKELRLEECPGELRPFMAELGAIGRDARAIEEDDTQVAIGCAATGKRVPIARMDLVKKMLVGGVGVHGEGPSAEGRAKAVVFANRINGLSLGMTALQEFRERAREVFRVLGAIGSSS